MIDIQSQWAIQVDITNKCNRNCSNCTRLISHVVKPFFMSVEKFREAAWALRDFPENSPPPIPSVANKVVGILGGEPLLHPQFSEIMDAIVEAIPEKRYRGLWTGLKWERTQYANAIRGAFGYINNNRHTSQCLHSPVLVAISDVIKDERKRMQAIDDCWLQKMWSGTITPKGLFFCEVAGAMDMVFNGPGGLSVEPDCWRRPLRDFQSQIDRWCGRCGIPLNLRGREDNEQIDDVTESNLVLLKNSPRIKANQYRLYDSTQRITTVEPWRYLQ